MAPYETKREKKSSEYNFKFEIFFLKKLDYKNVENLKFFFVP